jgi:DsbC/DsbD-like thiol-disulfide interchange protein
MKAILIPLLAVFAACQASPRAASPDGPASGVDTRPVEAALVADASRVVAGQTVTLGLRLTMKPEWHVYWKNPGDSGLPVSAKLTGPDGATFGEIQWPVPIRFTQPGDLVGYGYTDNVLLPITATVPKGLAAGSTFAVRADVSWLVCRDVCIPGKASLDLSLPVAKSPEAANAPLFEQWRSRLPAEDAAASGVVSAKTATGAGGGVSVDLDWKIPVAKVEWFPAPEPALDVRDISVATEGPRTRIAFTAEVLSGQKLSTGQLESLVVYTDSAGARRGVLLPVRLGVRQQN